MKTYFLYNKQTKIYTNAVTLNSSDPIPENATLIVPYARENLIPVFDEVSNEWNYITKKESLELELTHDLSLQSQYKGVTEDCQFIPLTSSEKLEKGFIKIEDEKERIKVLILSAFENSFVEIKKKYPQSEREGWAVLEKEAKDWLLIGNIESIPCLHAECGQTKDIAVITNLANKIIANSVQYKTFYGQQKFLLSQRLERLELATTPVEIYVIEGELK